MKFFIIIVCLYIFLYENAESKLWKCNMSKRPKGAENETYPEGFVCANITCNSSVDPTCGNGPRSEMLHWESDIFEIGFTQHFSARKRKIVLRIDLNKEYYIEINVITDREKKTATIILNECSHAKKDCFENQKFTQSIPNITDDETYVGIGFRNDKKINFAAVQKSWGKTTHIFSSKNVYEFKRPGFYFNTNETMNITVTASYDQNNTNDGVLMILPTSVGGFFFNAHGYFIHDTLWCDYYYKNPKDGEGLSYIIKEYFGNSENWRAPLVKLTKEYVVTYFNESGMHYKREQMLIKKENNPNFDGNKMMRKGCKYLAKPESTEESTWEQSTYTEESTWTEDEATEETEILKEEPTLMEEEVTKATKREDLKENKESIQVPMDMEGNEDLRKSSLPEGSQIITLPKITIGKEHFTRITDRSEPIIDLEDFLKRVGTGSIHDDYFKSGGGIEGNKYMIKLKNSSFVNIKDYQFANKNGKKKKTTKKSGSGGAGDASRGETQMKMIWKKYILFLILLNFSIQKVFKFIE